MHMSKIILPILLAALLSGCGNEPSSSSNGGSGETTTTTSSTTTGSLGTGGIGGTVDTTTTATEPVCEPPTTVPCLSDDLDNGYPNEALSFAPGGLYVGAVNPLPGENGVGAAAGFVGPFSMSKTVQSVILYIDAHVAFCKIPDPIHYAFWSEPLINEEEGTCHVPALSPSAFTFSKPLADVVLEDVPDTTAKRVVIPLEMETLIPSGEAGVIALLLDESTTCAVAFEPNGDHAYRSLWLGRSDLDCDGLTDADVGWAFLEYPTDKKHVISYPYDLGFGVVFKP